MERAIKTLMSKADPKDQAEIRRIVEVFSKYMTGVVIGNEVSQQNQSDICADVRKLKALYEKYGCSFPWQSTLEDIYDYEDFIGKFLYEIYNRKIIKKQLLRHMKSK